jgi:NAD(P)H-hydrate epimerase
MREADRRALADHGLPGLLLMERAGLASARTILERHPGPGSALVLVGPGNNGGDGMVVARHLSEAGWRVRVLAPEGREPSTPDAAVMAEIARTLGLAAGTADPGEVRASDAAVVVDALLGTGAHGAPRGALAEVVAALDGRTGVIALDVPTGVDADTGRVAGRAVRAEATITYHGDKPGLRVAPGREHAGEVTVADIGIPRAVTAEPSAWLVGSAAAHAPPGKAPGGDKYSAGAVLVVAGSAGLTGAATLAARATLRAGAGLAVAVVPRAVHALVAGAAGMAEVMVAPAPDEDGALAPASLGAVLHQAGRVRAVAVGPGLGRHDPTTPFVRELLEGLELPVVVDADALWHLAERPEWVRGRSAPTVLTPHAGEAGRLLGRPRAEVEADRLAAAAELAALTGSTVVLKGPGTVIGAPGVAPLVARLGPPGLATAGSGDVLTGVTAAVLARWPGAPAQVSAAAAVALHGLAAERAGRGDGLVAGDLVDALPEALLP